MRPLSPLPTTLGAATALVLLLNCSSAPEEAQAGRASANNAAPATSDGSTATATGIGGAASTDGAAVTGNVASTGAGAASSVVTNSAATSQGQTATTGPFAIGGVGGSFVVSRDSEGSVDSCQETGVEFTPDIPTVFILVDRSTSMWENMFWDDMRDGILDVVQRLHTDVRFGLGTFTGDSTSCPLDLQSVGTIDYNAYDAISAFYTEIMHPGVQTETPTPVGLKAAHDLLVADNAVFPGPKFIMLVTDGNPDYCDNGDAKCRADTTVRVLQDLYADPAVPTRTFVVALPDPSIDVDWLTAFANAGAGQPVSLPVDTQYCTALPPDTAALLPNVAPTTWPSGTYGATMGPATPYNVDPAQRDQLVDEIAGVIAGVKSCVFDLEGELKIIEGREAEGTVVIQTVSNPTGTEQPYDPTGLNGWVVNNGTQVELVGSACAALRDPETTGIEFGFPCDIIIPK